ncbi:MAG: putative secreted protein [Mycobacterium sp.]|nr:putative secreted protein [Mycobacterium sp.]
MRRFAGVAALGWAVALTIALITPTAVASAAENSATASIPIDDVTTLEVHTTANCVKADGQCYFTSSANLLTPDGPTGFPPQFYARQNTTVRSMDRMVYLDSDFSAPNTRMFKSIGSVEFSTVYFDGGPPEKFTLHGNTRTTDWATGRPKTDANFIACSYIQVGYANVNLTSPTACATTTY